MNARLTSIAVSILLLGSVSACTIVESDSAPTKETTAQQPAANSDSALGTDSVADGPTENLNPYSPYGVSVEQNELFDVVTFKDVGISGFPGYREAVMETVADSLAMNMSIDPSMPYQARFVHSEAFSDPNSHVYCDMNHIYVDVWTASNPDRVGYSLWSGCTESDQFAWEELPVQIDAAEDYHDAVQTLSTSIGDTIRKADETDCFTKTC